jgi:hypothetical protein
MDINILDTRYCKGPKSGRRAVLLDQIQHENRFTKRKMRSYLAERGVAVLLGRNQFE